MAWECWPVVAPTENAGKNTLPRCRGRARPEQTKNTRWRAPCFTPKTKITYVAPNATTAAPMAKTKTVVTTASVAALEGVFILSGDVASCSDGTDGSCSNQREYRSFTPWYAAPSWSRARYLCACSASPKDFSKSLCPSIQNIC